MKNLKLVVRNDTASEQDTSGQECEPKDEAQVWPMIGLSVGNFIQLISMDQQTCLVEVYHSANKRGIFYFIEGDLYNAECGDLDGEEAAMEMITWEKVRITINNNANMNDIARKIEKGLLSLLMEASRRRDESEWESSLRTSEDIVKDNEEVFKAVTVQSDNKTTLPNYFEEKLNECIKVCKRDMGDALNIASVISLPDGRALGGYNANSETAALFYNITASIRKVLEKSPSEELGRYYILDLKDDKTLFSFLYGEHQYQWSIIFDSSKVKLGLFLNVIIPKIIKNFEDAMTTSKNGSSSGKNLLDELV